MNANCQPTKYSATGTLFNRWVQDRVVKTPSSNVGSSQLPFQSWFHFKEAFAPEIVERAINETDIEVSRVLDPFGGSGTTALACQFLGVSPTTIEVNPFLADLIEAKLCTYDTDLASNEFSRVVSAVVGEPTVGKFDFISLPPTFVEPGVKGKFIFSEQIAIRIHQYRKAINNVSHPKTRRLLNVILAGTLLGVSNVVVSGKGRRYRRNWNDRIIDVSSLDEAFRTGFMNAFHDICRFKVRKNGDYNLIRGDARVRIKDVGKIDLAVFSPPYPNSFDYTDVYNVELWMMGYLDNKKGNTALRNATLRSHVQIKRDLTCGALRSPLLRHTISELLNQQDKLWSPHIPDMVRAYFADMNDVLGGVASSLRTGGRIYAVVGNSQYADILISTSDILAELAPNLGLKRLYTETFRSMRTSPQQGGHAGLAESLIVLEKYKD